MPSYVGREDFCFVFASPIKSVSVYNVHAPFARPSVPSLPLIRRRWTAKVRHADEPRRRETNLIVLEVADADVAAVLVAAERMANVPPSDARISADDEWDWLGKHVRHEWAWASGAFLLYLVMSLWLGVLGYSGLPGDSALDGKVAERVAEVQLATWDLALTRQISRDSCSKVFRLFQKLTKLRNFYRFGFISSRWTRICIIFFMRILILVKFSMIIVRVGEMVMVIFQTCAAEVVEMRVVRLRWVVDSMRQYCSMM